jgi:hypothetical protein
LPELVKLNIGAIVKVNIIDKVTVIYNVSAVKIRHVRWQALSSLFPTIIWRLRSSPTIHYTGSGRLNAIIGQTPVNVLKSSVLVNGSLRKLQGMM